MDYVGKVIKISLFKISLDVKPNAIDNENHKFNFFIAHTSCRSELSAKR